MAFIYALDNTAPADTDLVKDGAAEIREFKNAVIERVNSFFGSVENDPWQVKAGATFLGNVTQSAGTAALQAVTATTITASSNILAGASGILGWNTRASMQSPADGIIALTNAAATGFTRLQFGGTTASFPSLARSTTSIQVRLADNSALTDITALTFTGTLVGNADTTTKLATARNINGVAFDGTANITITASTTGTLTFGTHLTSGSASFSGTNATITSDATNLNTVSTIVARDASGNFVAGTPSFTALNVTSGTSALQAVTATTGVYSGLLSANANIFVQSATPTLRLNKTASREYTLGVDGSSNLVLTDATSAITHLTVAAGAATWTFGSVAMSGITTISHSGTIAPSVDGGAGLGSATNRYTGLWLTYNTGIRMRTSAVNEARVLYSDSSTAYIWLDVDQVGTRIAGGVRIGAGGPTTGASTLEVDSTIKVGGIITSTVPNGRVLQDTAATTSPLFIDFQNTSGRMFLGIEDSAGGNVMSGSTAYAVILNSVATKPVQIGYNNILHTTFGAAGAVTFTGALAGITTIATSSTINSQTISASANFTGSVTVASGFTVSAGTSAVQALTATSGVFTSFVKISATQLLYFDGGGDTYMSESSANVLNIIVGGADVFAMSGTVVRFSLIDLRIDSAKKFYLDGGGDTYIHESSANTMTLVVGGANAFSTTAVAATFVGDFSVPTTKKMYLDGGSNTYITESSADTITAVTGATNSLVLTSTTAVFIGSVKTADPGGGAGAWKLGKAVLGASAAFTYVISVDIDGNIRQIPAF